MSGSGTVLLHIWAPADSFWSHSLTKHFGAPTAQHVATHDGETLAVDRWTCTEDEARSERRVRRLFATGEADIDDRFAADADERERFWPKISFSTDAAPTPPANLLTDEDDEVTGGSDDLWIHFVDETDAAPYSVTYADAVRDSIWSIEEDFTAGKHNPAGWWVTVGPEPGARPRTLHSIF